MRVAFNANCGIGVQKPIILPNHTLNSVKNFNNKKDEFVLINKPAAISFRGTPELLPWYLKTYEGSSIDASKAIEIYEELKHAKYLDVPQNSWDGKSEPFCQGTRLQNLNFLNCLKDDDERKKFLGYYCNLTGFRI